MSVAAVTSRPSLRHVGSRPSSPAVDIHTFPRSPVVGSGERGGEQHRRTESRLKEKETTTGAIAPQNIPVRKQSLKKAKPEDTAAPERSPTVARHVTPADSVPVNHGVQRSKSQDNTITKPKVEAKAKSKKPHGLPPINTEDVGGTSASRLPPVEEIPPTPTLRSSASIPDYKVLRKAHPSSGSVSPRSPRSPHVHASSQSSSATRQTQPSTHGSFMSRDSTNTTNVSSTWDLSSATERSSVMTSRTSTSDYISPVTPWSAQPQEEEIGIDELLAMYANGFADDPGDTMSPVNRLLPPSPLGSGTSREASEPPVPKIPDSIPSFGILSKSNETATTPVSSPKSARPMRARKPLPKQPGSSLGRTSPPKPTESKTSLPDPPQRSDSLTSTLPSSTRSMPDAILSPQTTRSASAASLDPSSSLSDPSPPPEPPAKAFASATLLPPSPPTPNSASSLAPPRTGLRQLDANVRTSAAIMAGTFDPVRASTRSQSPPLPNAARDRYGFKKESQYIRRSQHDAWDGPYSQYLSRRREKWDGLMKQHDLSIVHPVTFPPRSDKVKRFVRKGIPPEWRGAAWFYYSGGPARLASNRGLYDSLLRRVDAELKDNDREHIERDLHRTLPDNDKFKPDVPNTTSTQATPTPTSPNLSLPSHSRPTSPSPHHNADQASARPETPHLHSLRRLLQTFAVAHPAVGYCQSLNFLAAHLLLHLRGDEEKAFTLLETMTSDYLPGTHGVVLEGANVDITVLMMALKEAMPALWARLDDRVDAVARSASKKDSVSSAGTCDSTLGRGKGEGKAGLPTVSLATTSWFMSCFVGTLPPETCCRVWDCLFYEGSKTLFRVALGVFKFVDLEVRAKAARRGGRGAVDPIEVFQTVQALPHTLLDAGGLMEASFGRGLEGRGLLSGDMLEGWREERRGVYQRQRDASEETLTSPAGGEGAGVGADGGKASSRRDSGGDERGGARESGGSGREKQKDKRPAGKAGVKHSASIKRFPTRLRSMRSKKGVVL